MEASSDEAVENPDISFENYRFPYGHDLFMGDIDQIEPCDSIDNIAKCISLKSIRTRSRSRFEKSTLSLFIDKNNRNPKKEYLRIQIIRGVKRAIREALSSRRYPTKKLHAVDLSSSASKSAWDQFVQSVTENSDFTSRYSSTDSGPSTDGKSSRMSQVAESKSKSYNDRFCYKFFSEIMQTSIYSNYLILVFNPFCCKALQNKFNFRPSGHNTKSCSDECSKRWKLLQEYISVKMIEDLGCYESEGI